MNSSIFYGPGNFVILMFLVLSVTFQYVPSIVVSIMVLVVGAAINNLSYLLMMERVKSQLMNVRPFKKEEE